MRKVLLALTILVFIALVIYIKYNPTANIGVSSFVKAPSTPPVSSLEEREDGVYTDYFSNGNIRTETPYKNGKINGIVRTYYSNGVVNSEVNFI